MGLRDKLREVIRVKDSPGKIAISFAIGIFIGMSPFLGIHTVMGIIAAWLFKLNKFVTIIGVYITNPWTIVPIYTFATWLGAKLLGIDSIIPSINWNDIKLVDIIKEMGTLLWPFVVGTTLLGLFSAIVSYIIVYQAVVRNRND
ncbi:MAG: hypothetical protein C0415_00790 [Thermodesulfovibrio sp.]|nr:hypothetical protein [Thermodesulfovibrio sp.]